MFRLKRTGRHGMHEYRCSFCDKSQDSVKQLVAGPRGVYICNECIDLCQQIIHEEEQTLARLEGREEAWGLQGDVGGKHEDQEK